MYCQKCGKEVNPGAAYCHNCGARVGEYSPAEWWWTWRRERWERHEWEPMDAVWGAISALGYLIIIGLTIFSYPNVFTLVVKYFESWGTYGHPVLPSYTLGQPIIFLFAAGGVWGILSSGLRLALTSRFARSLRGVVGGLYSLYFAFILNRFYARAFDGGVLVLLFFVGLAVMVLVNAMISLLLPRRRVPKQAPS
jgi:hypothetical protein